MNNISKLIKSKIIPFINALIDNYKSIGLSETDTILICKLYYLLERNESFLNVETLATQMNLSAAEISNHVLNLVKGEYVELNIVDGTEQFNIDGVIEKLGNVLNYDEKESLSLERKENISTLSTYLEKMFNKVITPNELSFINRWLDEERPVDKIKEAILEASKLKKYNVHYVDAILTSTRPKEVVREENINEDIRKALQGTYDNKR